MDSTKKWAAFALVALSLAAAIWLGAWTYPIDRPLPNLEFEAARSNSASQVAAECVKLARMVEGNVARDQAIAKCMGEAEQYRLTTNDLIQQTRSADAAAAQVAIGEQTLWLGWLQTIGGLLTLLAAAAAAWFARDAAIHGRRSADAAHASSRAWLKLSVDPKSSIEHGTREDFIFNPTIIIENVGGIPALNCSIQVEVEPYFGKTFELEYYSMVRYHHKNTESWRGDGIGFSVFPSELYRKEGEDGPIRFFDMTCLRQAPIAAITVVYETAGLHCLTTRFFSIEFPKEVLDSLHKSSYEFEVSLKELPWDRAT